MGAAGPALAATAARAQTPLNYLTGSGAKAHPVVALTWGVTIISVAVIVIITILVALAIWRRPGIPATHDMELALVRRSGGVAWLWIGTGISTLVLLFTIVWTVVVLAKISSPPAKPALTIEVTGRQWWWQVRYLSNDPSQVFTTANEIHIPTGVPIKFQLVGGDVIHSFWVPALAGKTDTIPGQTNETWLEAEKPGTYRGQCTEYCGLEHARMGFLVIAQSPGAFAAWRAHQLQSPAPPAGAAAAAGQADFTMHCGSCHAVRGTGADGVLGPDLSHLAGRQTIAAAMMANTPANLARLITDPQGVKPGIMMQKPELSAAELGDIQAYLATLK